MIKNKKRNQYWGINLKLLRANSDDMQTLTSLSTITFDEDSRKHSQGEKGGPPGYDSIQWQNFMLTNSIYYKVLHESNVVGGIILVKKGRIQMEIARIYIIPEFQNKGLGTEVLTVLERRNPSIKKWTLNTPSWAVRNQHFYEKLGYVKIEEQTTDNGPNLILYEKNV